MKRLLFVLLSLLLLASVRQAVAFSDAEPESLQVLSRESYHPKMFTLSDDEWRWLGHKRSLTIAVWRPEIPPLDMFTEEGRYEGMTADYILLISQYLGVRINLQAYASRELAMTALAQGLADMVVDTSGKQLPAHSNLTQSRNFISDHPVLVHCKLQPGMSFDYKPGMRLAIARWYVDDAWIEKNFPGARIMHFDTDEQAMASVAFHENDFFIGNLVTTSYLLERNFTNYLEFQEVYPERDTGSRFIIRKDDAPLINAVNQALEAIPLTQNQVILQQWSEGADQWRVRKRVEFTAAEKKWLTSHPVVNVSVNAFYAPFTMIDAKGNFYGVSADILRLITLRTGIKFNPVSADSMEQMGEQVSSGKSAFLGAVSRSEERSQNLLFSRPYFSSPFVTIVKSGIAPAAGLSAGSRVAMVRGNALVEELKSTYPGIQIVETDNASIAMQRVDDGKADVAIHTFFGANYMIDRYFKGQLEISGRVGEQPAQLSFAVSRSEPELLSILNKSLENISPADIGVIITKWQTRPDVRLDTWELYKTQFWLVVGVAAVIILTSLMWIFYLRREIRARRQAQKNLQSQLKFNETLINTLPVPVYVADREGNMLLFNQSLRGFFKGELQQQFGISLNDDRNPLHSLWRDVSGTLASGAHEDAADMQYSHLADGESERSIIHHAVPYADDNSPAAGLICTWMDVTEHENLTRALSEARERAEQANRAKSTFLATMSHEIRTPVSAIIGLLELAVKTSAQSGAKDNEDPVRVAWESARTLMGLIGDILDMARIESGRLELAPEWVRTTDLLPPIVRVFEGLARQKSLRLRCSMPPVLPYEVFVDPLRFRQVLSNVVSNAIKFTEKGSVEVDLDLVAMDSPDKAEMVIRVHDTGKGISAEEQKNIFDPWVQARAGRAQSGSGLGLAICAQLVHMMGGAITLQSRLSQGTTVTFRIPVDKHDERPEIVADVTAEKLTQHVPLRILAVDDHPANRMLLRRQLAHLGHHVTEARDGEEAWALWQAGQFELVITDCSMPGMDGLALTRLIREHQTRPVIILGLTANAWPEERNRCQDAGMDDCLFKPLQLPQLQSILNQAARTLGAQDPEITRLDALLVFDNLRALTHQDDKMLFELLSMTLTSNREDLRLAVDLFDLEDWPELAKCIHRISGAAQIIGAGRAEEHCRRLEYACLAEERDIAEISELWQHAREAVTELNDALENWCASAK